MFQCTKCFCKDSTIEIHYFMLFILRFFFCGFAMILFAKHNDSKESRTVVCCILGFRECRAPRFFYKYTQWAIYIMLFLLEKGCENMLLLMTCLSNFFFSSIVRHVQVNNEGAIRFYEKFGFEIVEEKKNYYKRIEPADAYVLQKSFRQPKAMQNGEAEKKSWHGHLCRFILTVHFFSCHNVIGLKGRGVGS